MEWKFCPDPNCHGELKFVPEICHHAYICLKCDEVYFEQRVFVICEECKIHHNTIYQLVTFSHYQASRTIDMFSHCAHCVSEWENG